MHSPVTMVQSIDTLAGYYCNNVDNNSIDGEGCVHLSKAGWHNLKYLNLGSSLIK